MSKEEKTVEKVELTEETLAGIVGKQVEERLEGHLKTVLEKIDEQLTPLIDQVKSGEERWVEAQKRDARLAGVPFTDISDEELEAAQKALAKEGRSLTDAVPKDEFSFVRAINGILPGGTFEGADLEQRAFRAGQEKALSMGTGSAGGYLVPTMYLPEKFIEKYEAEVVCLQAGAERLPNLVGSPVKIPNETTGASVTYLAENEDITETSLVFNELEVQPHMCAALIKMSRTLVRNSALAAEQIVRDRLSKSMGRGVDLAMLRGTGTNNQPTGIANTSNINTKAIGTNGGAFTPIIAKQMRKELVTDNVPLQGMVWIMDGLIWENLDRQLIASEANLFALQQSIALGTVKMLLGYPVFISNQIPNNITKGSNSDCSEAYLGKIDTLLLAEWGGFELEATQVGSTAFLKHQVIVKIVFSFDVGVTQPAAWCLCNDARDV